MNPEPKGKSRGSAESAESEPITLKPLPDEIHTKSRLERFAIGFAFGSLSGFLGVLHSERQIIPSLIGGLFLGFIVGGIGALFGKRVFDFLMALLTRFPG